MKKYLNKLSYVILFLLISFYSSKVYSATAIKYVNTVYAVMLCEQGSTDTTCLNPTILGKSSGKTMDIGGANPGAAAAAMGNTSALKFGKTYTYAQVVLDRKFQVSGSDGSCQTSATADAGTKTTFAIGKSGTGTADLQTVMIPNSTGNVDFMNGSINKDESTVGDSGAGIVADTDNYIKFRWVLAAPFTPVPGKQAQMTIAFDLSAGLDFNGTCAGARGAQHGITPGAPAITNTFK